MNRERITKSGISLVEILVVLSIFAVLGVLTTRSVLLTLRGAKKSESLVKVREDLGYALAVMEREIRNAESISPCPNPDLTLINYVGRYGAATSFSCVNVGNGGYIASGSARLTGTNVSITSCSFLCNMEDPSPSSVDISITAKEAAQVGVESAEVTSTTKIFLRTY